MKLQAQCPAAEFLFGPPTKGPSVICKIMSREDEQVDHVNERPTGTLITARDKDTVLRGFCCGTGHPKNYEGEPARGHYTFCPIWEAKEAAERERLEAEGRVFPMQEKPKILGDDPEVAAELLGMEPEQMQREERRFAERNPNSLTAQKIRAEDAGINPLGSEVKTGVEAMEEVANDPEWEEES